VATATAMPVSTGHRKAEFLGADEVGIGWIGRRRRQIGAEDDRFLETLRRRAPYRGAWPPRSRVPADPNPSWLGEPRAIKARTPEPSEPLDCKRAS
jgi:hypothetical protein